MKNQMTSNHTNRNRKAFTLAEALLAVVILGVAASGVLLPFSGGAAVQAEGARRTLAAKLAHDKLEEIVNTPFDDIVSGTELQGQIRDAGGAVFTDPAYDNFSRDVSCQLVRVIQQEDYIEPVFILVTVRVYYRGGEIVSLNRLVGQ